MRTYISIYWWHSNVDCSLIGWHKVKCDVCMKLAENSIFQRYGYVKNHLHLYVTNYYIFVFTVTLLCLTMCLSLSNAHTSWNTTFTSIVICHQFSTGAKDLFLSLCGSIKLISGKFPFWAGWLQSIGFSLHLLNLFLFHCQHKGFHIIIHLDDILVLICSKYADRRAQSFICFLLVFLGLHIIFSKSEHCHTQQFCFLGLYWSTVNMSVALFSDKVLEIWNLVTSLLQTQSVTVHQVMSFWGKTYICFKGYIQLFCLCHVIQSHMLNVYHLLAHLFCSVHLSFPALHQLQSLSQLHQGPITCNFLFLMGFLLQMQHPTIGPFIFCVTFIL